MTATPIPRTLAMTLYGDLDVSVIDELPPGRKPIQTIHQFDNRRASLYASIRKQIQEGRQVYIVYPLIQESEKMDIKNLEEGYEHICAEFPEYKVSKVHGKMRPADKETEMQRFVTGETQIMVATTVIEVGVNVPNASVMSLKMPNASASPSFTSYEAVWDGEQTNHTAFLSPVINSVKTHASASKSWSTPTMALKSPKPT